MSELSFEQFRIANHERKKQFFKDATTDDWSISDCFMAAIGELGETANALKKVKRAELGMLNKNSEPGRQIDSMSDAKAKVAGEIGGFMCYLDQLCGMLGLRLEDCIVDEFNKKSAELNLPERIVDGRYVHGQSISPYQQQPFNEEHMTLDSEGFLKDVSIPGAGHNYGIDRSDDPMKAQSDEFDTLRKLVTAFTTLCSVPIVDDEYPLYRGRYESAMMDFLRAIKDNGRTLPPWR